MQEAYETTHALTPEQIKYLQLARKKTDTPRKVVFIAMENHWHGVGGERDYVRDFSSALAQRGHQSFVFSVNYGRKTLNGDEVVITGLEIPVYDGHLTVDVIKREIRLQDGSVVTNYLLQASEKTPMIFEKIYKEQGSIRGAVEAVLLSKASFLICKQLNMHPDILFANDWQAGLANAYLNNEYVDEPLFKNTSSLFITHNISYQGVFDGYHVADPVIADEKGQSILTARGELNPTHPKYQLLVSGGVTKDDLFRLWSDRDQKEYIHIRLLKRNDRGLQVFEPADPDGYVRMLLATGVLKLNSTASLNNEGHSIMELAPVNDRDDSTHNLWGLPQSVVRRTGTPGFEYFAQAKTGAKGSLLKVGAGSSDTTVAVAPHTLEETFTPEKGAGMDGVMRRKKHEDAAQAVYNGCNVTPEVTEHIQSGGYEPVEANETATTLVRKKRINKINLYNQLRHLEVDNKDIREVFNLETLCGSAENFQEALTVVMMARFTEQKGFQDINEDFLRRLKAKGIKLVIFGDGDPATRESLKALAQNPEFGETFGLIIGYSETYADHFFNSFDVYAGHSLWEPAGIAQQKANIFGGTVAVLSNVGGHKSFVQDGGSAITYEMPLDQKQRRENWIRALETAADIKHNRPYAWREMMLKAQRFRFIADWRVRSAQYEKIFDKVLSRPRLANRHFVQFMDRLASRNIRFINEPADLYVLASLNERQLNPLAGYLIKDHGQTINNVDIDASMTAQDVADWVDGNFSSFVVQLKIEGTTLKVRKVQSGLPLSQAVSAARLAAKTNYVFSEKEGAFAQNTAWLIADAIAKRQNEKSPTSVVNVLLPTGSTVAAMYPLLAKRIGELATSRKLDPSRIHWYQAYEYKGIQKNDERSKAHYLKVNFFDYLQGVGEAQIHYIEEKSIDEYARSLAAQGGADIAIAAMGDDGHFWMVKPGSDMTASVLIRELDGGMKRGQNFNDLNDQDGKAYGITLGPVVMQKAHQVILVGSGISKKGIADRILKGLTISVDLLPSEWLYRLVQSQMILERTLAPDKFRTPDFNLLPGQSVIFHRDDLGEQGRMVSLSDNYKDGSVVIRAEAKSVYLDTHPLKVDTDSQSKAILTWPKNEEFLIVHGKPSRFGYTDSADIQKPSLNVEVLSGGEYVAVTNASSLNLLCHKVAEPMNGARLANNRRMEVGTGSNLLGMIEQMFELQKKEEGYFKIWDDGRNIKYIVLTRDGKRHVFTDYNEVLRLKETGNILCYGIVNPVRATRAGASSTVRIADNDPKAHAIDFDKIRDQYTNEYYIEWTSSASREWVLTFNLNASFPPIKDADPQAQPLYLTISRKDKTPQADMKNQENLEDMIELLILLDKENKSVKDKAESYRLLINGWYYSNNQEATSGGATQNQAHAQGMRRFLPIESESVTSLGRNGNVEIGLIDSKGYSPAIALTGDDDSWRQLAKIQARLLEGIIKTDTGRSAGDKMSFDISLAPAGGGRYRLVTFPRGRTLSTSDQAPLIGALGLVGVLEGLNEQAADQFTSNYYLNTTSELCASLVVVERFASQLTGGGDGARLVAGSQAGSLPNNAIEAIKLRPAGLPPAVVSARVAPPEDLAQLIKHSASAKNPAPVGARAAQFEGIQKGDYVSFVYKYWSAKAPLYGFVTYISRGYITIKGNDGKSYDFGPEISKYLTVSVAQSRADREWDEDHDANRKYRMGTYVPRDGEHGYGARLSRQTSVARVRAVSLPIRPQVPFRPALNHRLGAGQTRCHARYVEFAIQTMTTGQSGTLMVGEAELEFGIVVDTAGKKVLMIGGMGAGPVVIRDYRLSLRAVQRRLGMLQVSRTELLKQLGSQENEQRTKIWAAVGQSLKQLAGSPAVIELHLNGFNNADFRCVDAPELSRLLRILSKRNVLTVLKGRPEVINVLISQARHDYPEATFLYRDPKSLPDSHAKAPVAAIAAGKEDIMSIPSGCFRVGHEAVTRNSLTRYQSLLLIAELEAKMQTTGNRYFYKEHLRGAYQAIGIDVSDEKEWWEVISGNNTKWDIVQRYLARLRAIPMGAKLSLAARLARQIASMA